MSRGDETVEVAGEVRHDTGKALLFFDGARECWLPKKFITDNGDGTFGMPEWLAQREGLI